MSPRSNATDRLDTVFGLLSDDRRRYLLYYLSTVEREVVELSSAVDAVYEYEAGTRETGDVVEARTTGNASREAIEMSVHHDHLPRLAEAGILDYDRRQGTIRLTGGRGFEEWVEHARSTELE